MNTVVCIDSTFATPINQRVRWPKLVDARTRCGRVPAGVPGGDFAQLAVPEKSRAAAEGVFDVRFGPQNIAVLASGGPQVQLALPSSAAAGGAGRRLWRWEPTWCCTRPPSIWRATMTCWRAPLPARPTSSPRCAPPPLRAPPHHAGLPRRSATSAPDRQDADFSPPLQFIRVRVRPRSSRWNHVMWTSLEPSSPPVLA